MQLTEQRGDGVYYLEARRTFNRVFRCLKAVCSESKKRTRYFVVCCCYHDYDDDDDDDELRTTMLMIMSAFVCPSFPRFPGVSVLRTLITRPRDYMELLRSAVVRCGWWTEFMCR